MNSGHEQRNAPDHGPALALPAQVPPVPRGDVALGTAYGAADGGVEAAMRCADMTGLARQMCFARGGA
ncbi:hypothetical protein [Streptomyces sp. NPDC048644]|uniref:hypothetical protein n=1 Tax=Streptomyces sp. NPDC048644 TaxID=3365582 RepID=UPI00371EEA9D